MPSISRAEFQRRLEKIHRHQAVGITTLTVPDMRKRNNPYADKLIKLTECNGFINTRYTSVVNRQRTREKKRDDFQAVPRQWGIRIPYSPLVSHVPADGKCRFYLEVKVQHRNWWFIHLDELTEIPEFELTDWLRKNRKSRQDVDRDVILRDYRVDRIAEMRIDGETWSVRPLRRKLQTFREVLDRSSDEPAREHLEAAI